IEAPQDVQDARVALARTVARSVVAADAVLEVDELEVVALTPPLPIGIRLVDQVVARVEVGRAHAALLSDGRWGHCVWACRSLGGLELGAGHAAERRARQRRDERDRAGDLVIRELTAAELDELLLGG